METHRTEAPLAKHAVRGLLDDDSGVTAIEYGLLAALLALTVYVALGPFGQVLLAMYAEYIAPALQAVADAM